MYYMILRFYLHYNIQTMTKSGTSIISHNGEYLPPHISAKVVFSGPTTAVAFEALAAKTKADRS